MQSRKAKFFLQLTVSLVVMGISAVAFAQGDASDNAQTVEAAKYWGNAGLAMAAGLAIAIAAFGGAIAQGRAAAAALEGIARNPGAADKLFTPMILGLALIESLVIYALIIAFMIQNNIG